jgi:hypothetical protein
MQRGRKMIRTGRKTALKQRACKVGQAMGCFAALQCAAACSRAPSFNILGSFFPSWILCGLLGILLTVAARLVFVRLNLEEQLTPLILVYPCLTAFFTFTLWLVFFS